jgi:hypothetical protein
MKIFMPIENIFGQVFLFKLLFFHYLIEARWSRGQRARRAIAGAKTFSKVSHRMGDQNLLSKN